MVDRVKVRMSLCLCLHTKYSLCLCHSVYHHKWVDGQFFMADVQFFGSDAQFFRADAQFFAAGLLWPRNYAFCCCWTNFHPRNDGFVYNATMFTLYWACANSVLGMCRNNLHNLPCFWQFWLITMTETEHEHRLRLVDVTTSADIWVALGTRTGSISSFFFWCSFQ